MKSIEFDSQLTFTRKMFLDYITLWIQLITTMEYSNSFVRCYPFSDTIHLGPRKCCDNMSLVSALHHNLKCHTCLLRKDIPVGTVPIFPANENADEHFANNHIISCLICKLKIFHPPLAKDKASAHTTECIVKATFNLSRPYVYTNCLETIWLK